MKYLTTYQKTESKTASKNYKEISIYWQSIQMVKWYQKGRLKNSMKNLESVKKAWEQY